MIPSSPVKSQFTCDALYVVLSSTTNEQLHLIWYVNLASLSFSLFCNATRCYCFITQHSISLKDVNI